ncbi:MAG: gliding motility-associated-like protein [Flavobacteriales bacterium]|jgi:gliding motility-associated-like protein
MRYINSIKTITLFTLFTVNIIALNAQELTFLSYDIVLNEPDTIRMGNIDLNNCTYSTFQIIYGNSLWWYTDITLDTDSAYYGFIPVTGGTVAENRLSCMIFEPYFIGTDVESFNEAKQGMTCDREGNLYLAGEKLTRWKNGQITELGSLPPSMYCRGDLTFRQGKLYLSSVQNTLVEVDLDNPMNSSVVMTFPPGTPEIHGLTTVNIECDSVETYAAASEFMNGTTIYRIDFNDFTLEEICHYDFFVTGLASYDECIYPVCKLFVDLDVDDSSLANDEDDYLSIFTCDYPVSVSDTDVSLYSELDLVDSLTITLWNAATNGEYLFLAAGNNLIVSGNSSAKIKLINNGTSTVADFEMALGQILYYNDDIIPVEGQREIDVRAHFGPFQSSIATSFIPVSLSDIDAVFSVEEVSCNGNADASILSEPQGGTEPYNYSWSTNQSNNQIGQLDTGQYFLTITDALGCLETDSVSLTEPEELLLTISNPGYDSVCNGTGVLLAEVSGGTEPYTYTWSNGSENALSEMLDPGDFTVTVEDANGCQTEVSYFLPQGNYIMISVAENLCFGESYTLQGQQYTADTSFCLTYTLSNGCDSLRCYDIDFYEENLSLFSNEICYGDSTLIFGSYFSVDTTLSMTLTDANGCDSVLNFSLQVFDLPAINFETIGNLCIDNEVEISVYGFTNYSWSTGSIDPSVQVINAGEYFLTVTDSNNCPTSGSIYIEEVELDIYWSSIDPSCFGAADGMIIIDSIVGGSAPFATSLNNQPGQPDLLYSGLASGTYTIDLQDSNGCRSQFIADLIDPEDIYIQAEESISAIIGETINLSLTTNAIAPQVIWSPTDNLSCNTCLENTIIATASITYEIIVTDADGCTASENINIDINEIYSLFVPNVFSPNGDNINDYLKVYGSPNITRIIDLSIISRSGHMVYQSQNFFPDESQQGWDGLFLGQRAQTGVYILYVEYEDILGRVKKEIHDLTLVR